MILLANPSEELQALYRNRFSEEQQITEKNKIWEVLCKDFFQNYVNEDDSVVDIAAGYCEFINHIKAKRRIAIDANPDLISFAKEDVEKFVTNVFKLDEIVREESVNVCFVSNFLEHLNSKEEISILFEKMKHVLMRNGKIIILQPNIKYVNGGYWDFFDHKIPLTDLALIEIAEQYDLMVVERIAKFLPYTTKSSLPKHPLLVSAYLKMMPISGKLFGAQSFLVFKKR